MTSARPRAPDAVQWIARKLEDEGYETWAVGGAVRDALLEHPHGDWDLATRATPAQVRRLFRRTVPIGIEHGTVGVLRDGVMYEVTTFRKDVETDGRHAVVEFAETIADDLARRDFTINAICWHPLREEFFDPFGGARDLEEGVLRTVGVAAERFREDYLRILRAIRFAGRFDLAIDPATWDGLTALADHLPTLSPERVRDELLKVLNADPRPARALQLYLDSGVAGVLYPELASLSAAEWAHALAVVEQLPVGRPYLRLAALLRPVPEAAAVALLLRLRLSNVATDEIAHVSAAEPLPPLDASDETFRRWLSRYGSTLVNRVGRLDLAAARLTRLDARGEAVTSDADPEAGRGDQCRAEETDGASGGPADVVASWRRVRAVVRSGVPLVVSDLALDGRGLIGLGLKPGPFFGDILDDLLDWVLEDPERNQRSTLEARALQVAERLTNGEPEELPR